MRTFSPGPRFADLTGRHFGNRHVQFLDWNHTERAYWACLCICGNQSAVAGYALLSGKAKQCTTCRDTNRRRRLPAGVAARNKVIAGYRDHSAKMGTPFELSDEQFDRLTSGDCSYCGVGPGNKVAYDKRASGVFLYNGIDRLDNRKGYSISNCVTACKDCNHAKCDMSLSEFEAWLDRIVAYRTQRKPSQ